MPTTTSAEPSGASNRAGPLESTSVTRAPGRRVVERDARGAIDDDDVSSLHRTQRFDRSRDLALDVHASGRGVRTARSPGRWGDQPQAGSIGRRRGAARQASPAVTRNTAPVRAASGMPPRPSARPTGGGGSRPGAAPVRGALHRCHRGCIGSSTGPSPGFSARTTRVDRGAARGHRRRFRPDGGRRAVAQRGLRRAERDRRLHEVAQVGLPARLVPGEAGPAGRIVATISPISSP